MKMSQPASTGNGYPSFKFSRVGDVLKGVISSDPNVVERPKPNSTEMEQQLVFEVHTDEPAQSTNQQGEVTTAQDWTVWVKVRSQQYRAIFDAVKQTDPDARIERGDTIVLQLTSFVDVGKPSKMKEYAAAFKKGEHSTSGAVPSISDLL